MLNEKQIKELSKPFLKELMILNEILFKIWKEMKLGNDISAIVSENAMQMNARLDEREPLDDEKGKDRNNSARV